MRITKSLEDLMLRRVVKRMMATMVGMLFPFLSWAGPVDLNTADAETIARELNGVGQARAQAIVDYRNEYGAFQSTDELLNVTGIGKFILEANEQNILIESAH